VDESFVKFPRTPHLFWWGNTPPRGDKVLPENDARELLRWPASVEEKVDGSSLGFSVEEGGRVRAQSRGRYIEHGSRMAVGSLWSWLAGREMTFRRVLGPHLILYGEWCYALHSVPYDALSDWFLAFDVFDRREKRFFSRKRRDEMTKELGVSVVPLLAEGVFDEQKLRRLIGPSRLGATEAEGVYLRWDDGDWLGARAKVVRPGWLSTAEERWSKRRVVQNQLAANAPPEAIR
jgi:ATP-dependent RNA circularization protein (DNA/RNA ligase family)